MAAQRDGDIDDAARSDIALVRRADEACDDDDDDDDSVVASAPRAAAPRCRASHIERRRWAHRCRCRCRRVVRALGARAAAVARSHARDRGCEDVADDVESR